jgi:hypothetical protein
MLLCALSLAAVAAAQSFDELFPDSTIFYASVENAARTRERYEKSRLAALWGDEAVQAFVAKPRAKWAEWMEELRKKNGFAPDDVVALLSGQAAIGFFGVEGREEPTGAAIADIGENGEKVRELVARLEKLLLEEKGYQRTEEEFRGVAIVTYRKEGESGEDAWFLDGSMFAMAGKADLLKDLLVRKERRDEGTLASREAYRRTRGRLGARGGDLFLYFDLPNLMQALARSEDGPDEEDLRALGALGVSSIEALALEASLEPTAVPLRAFLAVKGPKTGVLKLFDAKNSPLLPPPYVPADAVSASAFALDIPTLYEEARKIAERMEEGSAAQMDAFFEGMKAQLGVDIPADMIGPLGAELTYHVRLPEKGAPRMPVPKFTLAIQLKEKERFEAALDKLLGAFVPGMSTQEYLGVNVRTLPTPMGIQPGIAVLADRLLVSVSVDDVKDVITRYGKEAKGMLDREDAAKALAALPAQRMAVSIEDLPKSLAQGSAAMQMALGAVSGAGRMPIRDVIDMSLFPSEEVLAKYLGVSTSCIVNEEDGVSILSTIHLKGE